MLPERMLFSCLHYKVWEMVHIYNSGLDSNDEGKVRFRQVVQSINSDAIDVSQVLHCLLFILHY